MFINKQCCYMGFNNKKHEISKAHTFTANLPETFTGAEALSPLRKPRLQGFADASVEVRDEGRGHAGVVRQLQLAFLGTFYLRIQGPPVKLRCLPLSCLLWDVVLKKLSKYLSKSIKNIIRSWPKYGPSV